jgi:copper chaperone NosL
MHRFFERLNRVLELPLELGPRGLLVLAALLLLPTYVMPLWKLTMFAPQYPEGLRMEIYSYKLEGAHGGQDIKEINLLNHYIGMKDLATADFTEFKWMPFVIGALALLMLRASVLGKVSMLVDIGVLYAYFGLFSLWSFAYKLYRYGHELAPTAAVKVAPFMPPLFGRKQLANFEVYSYPSPGSYALAAALLLLVAAGLLALREGRALLSSRAEAAA